MKLTVLSHDLSSNASMRAHRLAQAAGTFASVELIGPAEPEGFWPTLPSEPWIRSVPKTRFPEFFESFQGLIEAADGDVLIAVKPHLASLGAALVAAERRHTPVVVDLDDLDVALAPRSAWKDNPAMTDLSRPGSAVYVSLLTKCLGAVSAITVASTALQRRFGGTLIPHGCDTTQFDPTPIDRAQARAAFGFTGPTVLFPGAPRRHKGLQYLAQAMSQIPEGRLVVTCRPSDLIDDEWKDLPLTRIPMVPYSSLPTLLAAADIVVIPQLDTEAASYQTPMKIFEAMAMAKPIVTTTVGDLPEILGGCGRLVAPGDPHGLASAILRFLHRPGEAEALGERARTRCVQHFSILNTARHLENIVERLCPNGFRSLAEHHPGAVAHADVDDASGLRVHVDVMPDILSDLALPTLSRALDPHEFQRELARRSLHLADEPLEICAIHVLRYKPGRRCLIEYQLRSTRPQPSSVTLLGKVSARASSRKYEIQRAFWKTGFQDTSPDWISVAEPLDMIPQWHMWLQRKVSGNSVASLLLDQDDMVTLVGRVAEALNKVHRSNVETNHTHSLDDEMNILNHRIGKVIARNPRLTTRLEKILASCNELAALIPLSPRCGIHRDFYADQIILDGQRLYLLDFDLYCVGDPALDAGNFLGHLTEYSLRKRGHADGLIRCETEFRERFLRVSGRVREEAVHAYAVLTLVRHISLASQFGDRLHYTDQLIDLCERRLDLAIRACKRHPSPVRSAVSSSTARQR